jgi:SAM-dependent methyltransferase
VLVPDLTQYLNDAGVYLLARGDVSSPVADVLGAAMPPGGWFDATRQHLSGYVRDHWGWADPTDDEAPSPGQSWNLAEIGLGMCGPVAGPVVELGSGAGGVTWRLAEHLAVPVLGLDLSAPLSHFAVRALRGGTMRYPLRLSGTAYASRTLRTAPPRSGQATVWLADALHPPLPPACAGLVVALNILDCVTDPAGLLGAAARLLRPGGHLIVSTPYDWSATATPPDAWVGGRSATQASPALGPWAEAQSGLRLLGAVEAPWAVRVHSRAVMHYRVDVLTLRREECA